MVSLTLGDPNQPSERNALDSLLQSNVASTLTRISGDDKYQLFRAIFAKGTVDDPTEIQWTFVHINLEILLHLKNVISEALTQYNALNHASPGSIGKDSAAPPMSPDTLSFTQQKVLASAIQFIVTLGICPYLLPSVGLPLNRRSGYAHMIRSSSVDDVATSQKHYRLKFVCQTLMKCVPQATIGSIILSRHLGDILGALIQICYCPDVTFNEESTKFDTEVKQGNGHQAADKKFFEEQLKNLTCQVYQPVLVRELLILQGGSGPQKSDKVILVSDFKPFDYYNLLHIVYTVGN